MKLKIDKQLLPMKAHYFLFNAGTAPVVPFMPVYARQLGFSSVAVGTIYTVLPIIGMLTKPVFGLIADRFHRQKLLFLLFQILTAVAFFCIIFVPAIEHKASVEFHCNDGSDDVRFCPKNIQLDSCIKGNIEEHYGNNTLTCELHCAAEPWMWNTICDHWSVDKEKICSAASKANNFFEINGSLPMQRISDINSCLYFHALANGTLNGSNATFFCPSNKSTTYFKSSCEMVCNDRYIDDLLKDTVIDNKEITTYGSFWAFFMLLMCSWAGMAVVVSVGDAICFEMLGEKHHLYGNQRLWGAVGWGVFSVIAGLLVDLYSGGSVIKDYTIVFYMTAILIAMDMFVSNKLEHSQTKLSANILKDVGQIFLSARVVIFFVWCILVGLCTALIWNFLFWHLEDLGSKYVDCSNKDMMKTLQGLAMGIQCFFGELPFFFLSGRILRKIGHVHAMSLVLFGFGCRFLFYSFLENPWWVLPIELLNGVTFGIFYATMASYASIVAPPGTEATLQGLVGAVFEGVGVSTGSFIGGISFKVIGGSSTFRVFGFCALGACVVHASVQWLIKKLGVDGSSASEYHIPNDAVLMLDEDDNHHSGM